MMKHDECVKECLQAVAIGGVLTTIIFAFVHSMFNSVGEVLAFYAGTQMVATYAVWTIIDIMDRKRA